MTKVTKEESIYQFGNHPIFKISFKEVAIAKLEQKARNRARRFKNLIYQLHLTKYDFEQYFVLLVKTKHHIES